MAVECGASVDSVLRVLSLLGRAIESVLDRQTVAAVTRLQLSPSKVRLMHLLAHSGGHPLGRLAQFLGVSEPAASQLVDSLVRAKLIRREPDTHDRRAIHLTLRPKGKRLVDAIELERRHRVALALREMELDDQQWEQISDALERLAVALSAGQGVYLDHCLQCGAYQDRTCALHGSGAVCPYDASNRRS